MSNELNEFERDVQEMRAQLQEKVKLRELKSAEYRAARLAELEEELTPAVTALEASLSSFGNWRGELHAAVARVKELASQHARLKRNVDAAQANVGQIAAAHFDAHSGSAAMATHLRERLTEVASNGGTVLGLDSQTKEFLHIGGAGQNGWPGLVAEIERAALDGGIGAAMRAARRDWK